MTPMQVALASAMGGLLTLERKALAQFMLARPIVVAPIIGAILGDVQTGFLLGVPLELFFLGNASYGASTPDHETLAALFAVSLAVSAGATAHPVPTYALTLALLLALLATWPDPPWTPILFGGGALMVLMPIAFYPLSKTLWLAVDLVFRPAQPDDFAA